MLQLVLRVAKQVESGGNWHQVSHFQDILTGIMNKTFGGKEIMFWIFAQCSAPINRTKNCPELSSFILTPGQKNCIFLEGEAPGQLCLPELH